jgi:peptide-methionine (R)-S-oxide reductase
MTQPSTKISSAGYDLTRLSDPVIAQLASTLDPEARFILLNHGTERSFCGTLLDNKKNGTYVCRLCSLPLFRSNAKFDSGTGWPSFFAPYVPEHIEEITDRSHGMVRVEIRCQRCSGHLGHVFPDGPPPTGKRYCLNSASMEFVDQGAPIVARIDCDRATSHVG